MATTPDTNQATTASEPTDRKADYELGPEDDIPLGEDTIVGSPTPNVQLELVVPFNRTLVRGLQRVADDRGINLIDAVQRLVEEGLETRAHRAR